MEIVFLWVGLVFGILGLFIVRSTLGDFTASGRVEGEIIGYAPVIDKDGSRTFAPVIAFHHPNGTRCVIQSALGTSSISWGLREKVGILIDRNDPARARLHTKGFLIFGLVFVAIGLFCAILFFSIFSWGPVSGTIAVIISASLVWSLRRKVKTAPKLSEVRDYVRKGIGSDVVAHRDFDFAKLLAPAELSLARRRAGRQSLIGGIIMILIGAGAMYWSHEWMGRRRAFLEGAVPAIGRVVDLAMSNDSDSTTWAPVVEFTPRAASAPVTFRHSVASSHPSWKRGDLVRVLYDPSKPSRALIDKGRWNLAVPLIPGVCGALLAALGLLAAKSGLAGVRLE